MREVESHDQKVDGEQAGAGQQPDASRRAFALKNLSMVAQALAGQPPQAASAAVHHLPTPPLLKWMASVW